MDFTSNALATASMASVTTVFLLPGLISRSATSAAACAAAMTSACGPVAGAAALAPSTTVCAATAQ